MSIIIVQKFCGAFITKLVVKKFLKTPYVVTLVAKRVIRFCSPTYLGKYLEAKNINVGNKTRTYLPTSTKHDNVTVKDSKPRLCGCETSVSTYLK